MDEPAKTPPASGKRPYRPPSLRTFGTLRDLTLTNAAGPNFDGGGGANIYMS